jgi:hypothetical protein
MKKNFSAALLTLLLTLTAQSALAVTTTLNFDDIPSNTQLTNQYQSLGVIASGVTVVNEFSTPWSANTPSNVAYAPTGLMTFTLDQSVLANVQTVSAYVSGITPVGIYAYDSSGTLVGSAAAPSGTLNALVTVTSSGNPIASITIHDGGSAFIIDTLMLTQPDVMTCDQAKAKLRQLINALTSADLKWIPPAKRLKLVVDIATLAVMFQKGATDAQLLKVLYTIRQDILNAGPASDSQAKLLSIVDQMIAIVSAHLC